jgi:hypothetical protein
VTETKPLLNEPVIKVGCLGMLLIFLGLVVILVLPAALAPKTIGCVVLHLISPWVAIVYLRRDLGLLDEEQVIYLLKGIPVWQFSIYLATTVGFFRARSPKVAGAALLAIHGAGLLGALVIWVFFLG